MEGFIQLHRQMLDWEWYNDINTKTLFIHLLLKANWKDKKWRGIDVYRGEYITSFGKLSEETGLSIQQVRTSIKKLKSTQEVTHKGQGSFSIIKVLKYDDYQGSNTEDNKPITSEQQGSNKGVTTTNKVIKKERNKEIINTDIIINPTENKFSEDSFEIKTTQLFIKKQIELGNPSFIYLYKKTEENTLLQKWANEVRKMGQIDKYTEEQITFIINYLFEDDFWRNQISSMEKFRKKNRSGVPYFIVLIESAKKNTLLQNKKAPGVTTI